MRWGVYARDGFEGALAFRQGLLEAGERAALRSVSDWGAGCFESFDAVVVFGLQGKGSRVKAEYDAAGIPVVVADFGYVKRTNHEQDWHTGHWQLSVGGLNHPPSFECSPDRFKALGVDVAERGGNPNGYTLLCVQTTDDASHGMDEQRLKGWREEQARQWPNLLMRPHPMQNLTYGLPVCQAETMKQALKGARLVVTGNSNSGHDALIAGVPAVATLPGAAWAELSGTELPSLKTRQSYFSRLAWGQWTWDEFRTGQPQRFLIERCLN